MNKRYHSVLYWAVLSVINFSLILNNLTPFTIFGNIAFWLGVIGAIGSLIMLAGNILFYNE
jgi:ABC-type sulfate transport system permease component